MAICKVNEYGQIETIGGVWLEKPAIQIAANEDMFIRVGDYDTLLKQFTIETERLQKAGMRDMFQQAVISLENLSAETACYVIRRMTEYTASGFIKAFYQHLLQEDIMDWLQAEIKRVPIPM